MPLRRGRDVTIAKLACSAFTAREKMRFEEVDTGDILSLSHTLRHTQMLWNMTPSKCVHVSAPIVSTFAYMSKYIFKHAYLWKWMQMNWNDWQENHQYHLGWCWQMDCSLFSGCIPLPFSNSKPCPGQKLDRHSTIKPNEECAFNEKWGG